MTPTGPTSHWDTTQPSGSDATLSTTASSTTGASAAFTGGGPSSSAGTIGSGGGGVVAEPAGSTLGGASVGGGGVAATGTTDTSGTASAAGPSGNAGAAASTDAAGSTGTAVPASFAEVQGYVIGYCATSTACHGSGAREVVFSQTTLFDTLRTLSVARCENQLMVVPYSPAESALYNVLTGGCGNFRMPPACQSTACTGADNVRLVESWIQNGAPGD